MSMNYLLSVQNGSQSSSLLYLDDSGSGDLIPKEKKTDARAHIFHTAYFSSAARLRHERKGACSPQITLGRVDLMFAQPLRGIGGAYGGSKGGGHIS